MLFPFDSTAGTEQLPQSERFRVHREGLDVELLTLEDLAKPSGQRFFTWRRRPAKSLSVFTRR
jgi:hypothetical protein